MEKGLDNIIIDYRSIKKIIVEKEILVNVY